MVTAKAGRAGRAAPAPRPLSRLLVAALSPRRRPERQATERSGKSLLRCGRGKCRDAPPQKWPHPRAALGSAGVLACGLWRRPAATGIKPKEHAPRRCVNPQPGTAAPHLVSGQQDVPAPKSALLFPRRQRLTECRYHSGQPNKKGRTYRPLFSVRKGRKYVEERAGRGGLKWMLGPPGFGDAF